jgi:excinuclease ABC subunit A
MVSYTDEQILQLILEKFDGKAVLLLAPVVKGRKGHYKELFESIRKKGFTNVRIDGEMREIASGLKLDRYKNHDIEVVIDKLIVAEKDAERIKKSLQTTLKTGGGVVLLMEKESAVLHYFSSKLMCPQTGLSYAEVAPHNFSFNTPKGACPRCGGLGVETEIGDDENIFEHGYAVNSSLSSAVCPECNGTRLNRQALSYIIAQKNIAEVCTLSLDELKLWLDSLMPKLSEKQRSIAAEIIKELSVRVDFLLRVGLNYLTLARAMGSLSGGEGQRIRLATQIGSQLVNVLYVLDEPSIGLHQRDNIKLINSLKSLRDIGNSVIVVEHDEEMMMSADYIVDMGPGAGRLGGYAVFQGTPQELLKADTLTASYLNGKKTIEQPKNRRTGNGKFLTLRGASGNNLKNVDLKIPLGMFICVAGVSGSGKSSLINRTLHPILSRHFYRSHLEPLPYKSIEGIENIDKIIEIDQLPIGRTSRSNPATYTGAFTDIRNIFASLTESKMRGYKSGRFSFNVAEGRCPICGGNGYKTLEMNFLPDVMVFCEECQGKRYNRETLEVRFKGKSIADVLDMTINQAVEFFENIPSVINKIKMLQEVGLGYIKLGQSSSTLSGGENQRVKLAAELARRDTGNTLYILDEPTTGLHFEDIKALLKVLNRLAGNGNTVIVIEHNLDVLKCADYIIELGPDAGRAGGEIIACGSPELLCKNPESITAPFLLKNYKL